MVKSITAKVISLTESVKLWFQKSKFIQENKVGNKLI